MFSIRARGRSEVTSELAADVPVHAGRRLRVTPFDLLVPLVLVALAALTGLIILVPGIPFVAVFDEADHVINSAAALAAGGVATLAWIRYSQTRQPDSLFQAAAFMTLFVGGATSVAVLLTGLEEELGFDRFDPGQGPLYLWTMQRFVAALLLLIGAVAALRQMMVADKRVARLILILPALAVLLAGILILLFRDYLPVLVPPEQLQRIAQPADLFDRALLSPALLISQLVVATLYLAAAVGYARLYKRTALRPVYIAYLAAGLSVAAFSQVHYAVMPGNYQNLVTSGDVLRAGFYLLLLVGVAFAARADLIELRRANETLIELRAGDAHRVALEERARLAREIHDGLVQDLWLARLTHGRLVQMPDLPDEAREVATRVDGVLEEALAEARQAIVALQPQSDASFGSLLTRFVEDFGDRFGLDVDCSVEGEPLQLPGHTQAEVLRICREALNNARKHADATVVRVDLRTTSTDVVLRVSDNGRGFDPTQVRPSGFGLKSMRDRAGAINAKLAIASAPADGTRVTLTLPLVIAEGGPERRSS